MPSLTPLRALVVKDLKVWRSDRRAVLISFVLPAVFSLIFGFIFKGDRSSSAAAQAHIKIDVVDEDQSETSHKLAAALAESAMLAPRAATLEQAREDVRKGKASVAVVLPKGFGETTRLAIAGNGRERARLTFLSDPTSSIETQVVKGVVNGEVIQVVAADLGTTGRDLMLRCGGLSMPYFVHDETVGGGDGASWNGAAHALAGMAVQFILMGAIEMAVAMLTDRQRGVWKRMRAAPLSRVLVIGSRLASGALIAGLVLAFLYAFGALTLGIRIQGAPLGFALVAVSFALMTSALGLAVSTLARTPQAARGVGIFVVLVAVMLGGAWFPSFLFPPWLRTATLVMPTRWAVDGLDAMTWRGLGLADALLPTAVLLVSAVVLCAIAAWRFRWEE